MIQCENRGAPCIYRATRHALTSIYVNLGKNRFRISNAHHPHTRTPYAISTLPAMAPERTWRSSRRRSMTHINSSSRAKPNGQSYRVSYTLRRFCSPGAGRIDSARVCIYIELRIGPGEQTFRCSEWTRSSLSASIVYIV